MAMGEFHAGGRRLVQHAEHLEAPSAKGLGRKIALVGVGVGGDAQHGLERLARLNSRVRMFAQRFG